jgi:LysM repeat protein
MKNNKSIFLFGIFILCGFAFGQTIEPLILNDNYNTIQFKDSKVLNTLNVNWNNNRRLSVLHLGDSHLQNENLPNKCRQLIQQLLGDGGIGLIQPFSIVKSYNASFYKSTHTGEWEYSKSYILPPKIPLGVRGMSAKTVDDKATFEITFNNSPSAQNNVLTVFYSNVTESYEPNIIADSIPARLISNNGDILKYQLPSKFTKIHFSLMKTNENQNQFTLYGMSLSNIENTGAIWHNAGVGACQYKSVLFEEKYEEQASYLNPDLIIIDYGTNDFLYSNTIPEQLTSEIQQVITKVKKANPRASIILTSAQDMNYKKINVTASKPFSKLVKKLAFENQCGFWDWYLVSGGAHSMDIWQANKLTMNDGIHLNGKGSELKGTLLFEALRKSNSYMLENPEITELDFEDPIETETIDTETKVVSEKIPERVMEKRIKKITYRVKNGDTLGEIAEKFKISLITLKKQNKLRNNKIKPNQILFINKK